MVRAYTILQPYWCIYNQLLGKKLIVCVTIIHINADEKVDLGDSKWEDIHVTTGALKMFFRELPEPLFTYAFFNDFIAAISEWRRIFETRLFKERCFLHIFTTFVCVLHVEMPDYKHKVQTVKDLMKQLPRPNHDTIQVLFKHLKKWVLKGKETKQMMNKNLFFFFTLESA